MPRPTQYSTHSTPVSRRPPAPTAYLPLAVGLLTALAASAAYVRYQSRKVEKDNPPAGQFIEVDGVRLHYVERGRGQPLVLLHGNGTSSQEIDSSGLIDILSTSYRVIAFDRPGYGYSERPGRLHWDAEAQAELIHEALQRLDVEKPIIVAHSWATMVAIGIGLRYPGDVRGLLLLSGYYFPTPRVDVPLFSPAGLPVVGDAMRYTVAPVIGRAMWPAFVRKLFAPASTPDKFKNGYPVWMTLRPGQLRATTEEIALMIPSAAGLRDRYRELDVPTIIMAGQGDLHAIPQLHSERLHAEIRDSELILVPGVGHMITHSATEEVVNAIDTLDSRTAERPPERIAVNARL